MFLLKGKTRIIVYVTVLLLLGAALLGVVMQLRSLMSDEEGSKTFGGKTVFALDFNSSSEINSVSDIQTTLDYGHVMAKVGTFTEGNGSFIYNIPANSVSKAPNGQADPYVHFAFGQYDVKLDDFSAYMLDFDVHIAKYNGCLIYFNVDYRSSITTGGYTDTNSQLCYINGKFYLNSSSKQYVGDAESDTFHITYIINHEKTLIYVDGKLLAETVRSYIDGAETAKGFRMGVLGAAGKAQDMQIVLDNVVINKFAPDYNGSIQKLFSNPDVLLKNNSDTIFGGAFVWPEE